MTKATLAVAFVFKSTYIDNSSPTIQILSFLQGSSLRL